MSASMSRYPPRDQRAYNFSSRRQGIIVAAPPPCGPLADQRSSQEGRQYTKSRHLRYVQSLKEYSHNREAGPHPRSVRPPDSRPHSDSWPLPSGWEGHEQEAQSNRAIRKYYKARQSSNQKHESSSSCYHEHSQSCIRQAPQNGRNRRNQGISSIQVVPNPNRPENINFSIPVYAMGRKSLERPIAHHFRRGDETQGTNINNSGDFDNPSPHSANDGAGNLIPADDLSEYYAGHQRFKSFKSRQRKDFRQEAEADGGNSSENVNNIESVDERLYPPIEELVDPARKLHRWSLLLQRTLFVLVIIILNGGALAAALLSPRHLWVLVFILFIKSKDLTCTVVGAIYLTGRACMSRSDDHGNVPPKWILSLVPAYSETNEQIIKTIDSILKYDISPHRQVLCVILDGKPKDLSPQMSSSIFEFRRPYVTFKHLRNELKINAGFMGVDPVIILEKTENAGKKDSLILCHDIFNHTRSDAPLYTCSLKKEIFETVLPSLIGESTFDKFDMIFCTDADSTIHEDAIRNLANALIHDQHAVAACGVVFAEMSNRQEWSTWFLFQQFQYTFGQFIRRQAESIWGRVTCLPGCIQMLSVRREMAEAISLYAKPVKDHFFLRHQIQYLGTDRRLTYCLLVQDPKFRTIFVPSAGSETVAPQTLTHYLSQRRRWASNAYFNCYPYLAGSGHRLITRTFALVDIVRLSMVYYRVANTVLFIYGLVTTFTFIEIVPLLVVTQTPAVWYLTIVIFREPKLRKRAHKLILGMAINKIISPILSLASFTMIALRLGHQTWGKTGVSTKSQPPLLDIVPLPLRPIVRWLSVKMPLFKRNNSDQQDNPSEERSGKSIV